VTGAARPGLVAIAGAGIAGLSAAIALKLAGIPAEVFEREEELRPVGAGIQLGPNATRILQSLGVILPPAACEPEALELRNARTGQVLNAIPFRGPMRERYGAPYLTMLRADLQSALLARAQHLSCPIRFGHSITSATGSKESILIELSAQSLQAAALIGADGLNSTVRTMVSSLRPVSAQAVAWRTLLPASTVPAPSRNLITLWMGPGAHLVHYPVSAASALNAVLIIDNGRGVSPGPATGAPPLLRHLDSWADTAKSMIAAAPEWQPWPLYYVPKSSGGNGRMQLIGDAWHAMPPFLASGGAMAIEDGAQLATKLSAREDCIVRGLELFRESRGRRVWRTASRSSRMGRVYHFPRPFDAIRDLVIRAAPSRLLLARNDWLYGAEA
jgi:salicylate hydroxylase